MLLKIFFFILILIMFHTLTCAWWSRKPQWRWKICQRCICQTRVLWSMQHIYRRMGGKSLHFRSSNFFSNLDYETSLIKFDGFLKYRSPKNFGLCLGLCLRGQGSSSIGPWLLTFYALCHLCHEKSFHLLGRPGPSLCQPGRARPKQLRPGPVPWIKLN